jgi:putative membrane protein
LIVLTPWEGFVEENQTRPMQPKKTELLILLALTLLALVVSGIGPTDRMTWWLEVLPVLIAIPLLLATWRVFPLTPLLYRLIFLHALILMLGGHYTYAQVPLGFWVQDAFDLSRNHYDRLGHVAQGFEPAILAREICLAFSAFFEMFEWWVSLASGAAGDAFLATQGDPWDTQWDMFLALIGAIAAQLLLAGLHDRQLARLVPPAPSMDPKTRKI